MRSYGTLSQLTMMPTGPAVVGVFLVVPRCSKDFNALTDGLLSQLTMVPLTEVLAYLSDVEVDHYNVIACGD